MIEAIQAADAAHCRVLNSGSDQIIDEPPQLDHFGDGEIVPAPGAGQGTRVTSPESASVDPMEPTKPEALLTTIEMRSTWNTSVSAAPGSRCLGWSWVA